MMKIVDGKIWHDGKKVGWIDGSHIRDENDVKLGHIEGVFVCNEGEHHVAYIKKNELVFLNGNAPIPIERINQEIVGTVPLMTKCAVHVLFEG